MEYIKRINDYFESEEHKQWLKLADRDYFHEKREYFFSYDDVEEKLSVKSEKN